MKKDNLWYRSRGLESMESRFGNGLIKNFIVKRLKTEKKARILEIGFGEGKCLLDLSIMFPDKRVELFGINNIKKGNMRKRSDFALNAKHFGIKLENSDLPKPYFYDASNGLKFKNNYFDLIISQVSFHYVADKAKLIEEIWRVLKIGGKAFLHIDSGLNENYPDFMKSNKETPRFIVYKDNKIIRLSKFLRKIRNKGYNIMLRDSFRNKTHKIVLITKNKSGGLNLRLRFDGNSTLNLTSLKNVDGYKIDSGVWWGTRSVFNS